MLKMVRVAGTGIIQSTYLTHPYKVIKCKDKKGRDSELGVRPSIEMRVTYINSKGKKKRKVFYYDRAALINGYLYGTESRFISVIKSKIPIDSIKLIEVQDGKKNFYYVD